MPLRDPTPSERSLLGRIGGHAKWAKETDRSKATEPARRAFLDQFERAVDPDGVLPDDERMRRAEHARKAHFARLALKSARVRRERSARRGGAA